MNPSLNPGLSAKTTHWVSHGVGVLASYGFAVVAMAAAMGLRTMLMAKVVSAGIALYYILPPIGQFAVASPIDGHAQPPPEPSG
jgi:hypothetical protein